MRESLNNRKLKNLTLFRSQRLQSFRCFFRLDTSERFVGSVKTSSNESGEIRRLEYLSRSIKRRRAIIATKVVSEDCAESNLAAFFQMSIKISCTASSASSVLGDIRRAKDQIRPP
jgi:hypothetical protein